MNKSRQITEGALLTAVYIVLLLIVFFIPVLQLFGIFILPVPFAIYTARHGWQSSMVMALLTLIFTGLFATVISLPMTLFASVGGIIVGNGMYHKKNAYDTWAKTTVGNIASLVLILALMQFVFSVHLFDQFNQVIDETMAMMRTVTSQLQMGTDMAAQLDVIEEQMRQFPDLLPSAFIIVSILFAWITQWLSYKVVNRVNRTNWRFPPFKQLNFPPSLIWVYFIVFLVSFMDLQQGGTVEIIIINAMALLSVLLIIQGFSFIFFFADYKKMHKALPVSAVIVTILIPFIFLFIVEITGIIDLGFSLKKKINENKT